jgi:hypothetical protein
LTTLRKFRRADEPIRYSFMEIKMNRPFRLTLLFLSFVVGCVAEKPISSGQACPCATNFHCDLVQNVCIAGPAGAGGSGTGDAGMGSAGTGGTGVGGAGTGAAGIGGTGTGGTGTGGAAGALENDTAPVAPGCEATCATPAGTVQDLTTIDAAYTAMQGRWEFCDTSSWRMAGAPADAIGIDFAPASRATTSLGGTVGGMAYYLVAGPSGPMRGQGFAYQLTYDLSPLLATSPQLNIHPGAGGFGGTMRYSPCPTELEVNFFYPGQPSTMVRFAPGDGVEHGDADASSNAPDGGGDADGGSSCPTDGPEPSPTYCTPLQGL